MKNFSDFFVFLRVTVDELRLTEKKERRKKKEEEEQNGCFLRRDFSTEQNATRTSRVALHYISEARLSD